MSIAFECEQCHRRYQVADDLAGKRGRCKQCGYTFTIPAGPGLTAEDLYALVDDSPPSNPHADQPPLSLKGKRKKQQKVSGLFGLSTFPLWGFNVYRGVIVAVLAAALLASGVPKFTLALIGAFMCVGPFIACGFAYRFGVAFSDGLIAGLLYMFFMPYRIHYRLTHREQFQKLRAPSLMLRDFSLLLLGLCFLPVVILAAKDMDKLRGILPRKSIGPGLWVGLECRGSRRASFGIAFRPHLHLVSRNELPTRIHRSNQCQPTRPKPKRIGRAPQAPSPRRRLPPRGQHPPSPRRRLLRLGWRTPTRPSPRKRSEDRNSGTFDSDAAPNAHCCRDPTSRPNRWQSGQRRP